MAQNIRIGIDGVQGSGKTTLLGSLPPHFGRYFKYIPEASRTIAHQYGVRSASDWPTLLYDKPKLDAFFDAEEAWQTAQEDQAYAFIVDSSLWLTAAYREMFHSRSGLEAAKARKYQLLLHCLPAGEPSSDGFRFTHGSAELYTIYNQLVRTHFRGEIVELPSGDDRVMQAAGAIRRAISQRDDGSAHG